MEISQWNLVAEKSFELHYMIIPTVLIPLTMVSVAISVAATFIAGLFGVKLKAEGPKQLLEVLLKPRILFSALLLNAIILGGIEVYKYINTLPSFLYTIKRKNQKLEKTSTLNYENVLKRDNTSRLSSPSKNSQIIKNIDLITSKNIKSGVFRGATISGDSLFIGGIDGFTYELNPKNLEIKRKFFIGTMVTPAPLIFNNSLYIGEGVHKTHHARIYKFNLKTGKFVKSYSTKGHTEGQGLIATYKNKTLLFIPSGGDGLHAIDPVTMKKRWHQNDGHLDSTVTYENGIIYAGSGRDKEDTQKHKSYATAYNFTDGKRIWKRELPASSWMKPIIVKEQVCFVMGEIYFKSHFGGLSCFYKENGLPSFTHRTLTPIASIPYLIKDNIYYSDIHGKICKLNMTKTKRMRFERESCFDTKTKGISFSSISFDQKRNILLYASKTKGLYILHPKTMKLIYHWLPNGKWQRTYASVAITKENDYFIADMKGNIYLLRPNSI